MQWVKHLTVALCLLNEQPRKTGVSPIEKLFVAHPCLLKYLKQDPSELEPQLLEEILLLPAPCTLSPDCTKEWTWPCTWVFEGHPLVALYKVWGEGLTHGLQTTPWIGKLPFKLTASLLDRATAILARTLVMQV